MQSFLILLDLRSEDRIFLLFQNQLFDNQFPIILLNLELGLKLVVFLQQRLVLVVDFLGYVLDPLKLGHQLLFLLKELLVLLSFAQSLLFELFLYLIDLLVEELYDI